MSHDLAIVVLVYNSAGDARACVDRLVSFDRDWHVVVVDNCSPDGSFEVLSRAYTGIPNVDVIQTGENRGYSAGNNFGIRYAMRVYGVDTVSIMNPDVLMPNASVLDCLLRLLWLYDDCLVVGGQPVNHLEGDEACPSSWSLPTGREVVLNHCLLHRSVRCDAIKVTYGVSQVDCIVGCFFVAKAQQLAGLGLLDENVFLYNEENILGMRCRRAGWKLLVDKGQVYYHNHRSAAHKKTLLQRIATSRDGYCSRRYLVATFYSTALRFPLWCMEALNEAIIFLAWLRHDAFMKRAGDES
ncbi:glycosyltransferase family 2 protein [Collinsella sp. LCP19S3_C6]|uniref:glycosyltransferase family 2 protein n=1 Tax=unclassified Collinsella TaxID=2637548 RepID=UPI003F8B2BED